MLNPDEATVLGNIFAYHAPSDDMLKSIAAVRASALAFAVTLLEVCPRSADRSAAIRHVREAMMTANASIVLGGLALP